MADQNTFNDRVIDWKKYVRKHWSHFDEVATRAYSLRGLGAVLIDISTPPGDAPVAGAKYPYITEANADSLMDGMGKAIFGMSFTGDGPSEEVHFLLADLSQGDARSWRQRKHPDGSPVLDPDLFWRNRKRACPKCRAVFTSVQARGQCPNCGHIFVADESNAVE